MYAFASSKMDAPSGNQETFQELLTRSQIEFQEESPLSKFTSFQVGGPAKFLALPKSIDETILLYDEAVARGYPVFILGGGSNLLVSDAGFAGLVIKLNYPKAPKGSTQLKIITQSDTLLEVAAPANMKSAPFARKISEMGYGGAEFLTTIPGELGGALTQNAGCYGSEMARIVDSALISIHAKKANSGQDNTSSNNNNSNGKPNTKKLGLPQPFSVEELELAYRSSMIKTMSRPESPLQPIVHEITFSFPFSPSQAEERPSDESARLETAEKIRRFQESRLETQPRNRRTAGSIFKNPAQGPPAWDLIRQCNLQGMRVGKAQISEKHANFIENQGGATAAEIYSLISMAQSKVKEKFGTLLELEVVLLGDL